MASKVGKAPVSKTPPRKPVKKPARATSTRSSRPAAPRPRPQLARADRTRFSGDSSSPSGAGQALASGIANNFAPVSASAAATDTKVAGAEKTPGQRSVDYARQFEGQLAQDVTGQIPGYNPHGRTSNNCADFVSSVLKETGRTDFQTASVGELREKLQENGWREIPRDQAQPGDVWMTESNTHGSRHTELVTEAGGTHTIGSNNISSDQQQIFEREKEGGVYYTDRPAEPPPVPEPNPNR